MPCGLHIGGHRARLTHGTCPCAHCCGSLTRLPWLLQVAFTYNPHDDLHPGCSWRWLLEYGFAPPGPPPQRDCYAWALTWQEVQAADDATSARDLARMHAAGRFLGEEGDWEEWEVGPGRDGQADRLVIQLDGAGRLAEEVLPWLSQQVAARRLRTPPEQLLLRVVQARTAALRAAVKAAAGQGLCRQQPCACAGLHEVAEGGVKALVAAAAALQQQQA